MLLESRWLLRGFFEFGSETTRATPTEEIRHYLSEGLKIPIDDLHRKGYPVGPAFRHTLWWREGEDDYSEMQFIAHISPEYPVLTLGVSIEKGFENKSVVSRKPGYMVRNKWDWSRFLSKLQVILDREIPSCSERVKRPVYVKIFAHLIDSKQREHSVYNLVEMKWFKRHSGGSRVADITETLLRLDALKDWWVNCYIGCDFSPQEVEQMDTKYASQVLLAFAPLRALVRG